MDEKTAKTKWCPMVRSNNEGDGSNRTYLNELQAGSNCIASGCMMWRTDGKQKYLDKGKLYDKNLTDTGEWIHINGYCGLAK